MAAYSNGAIRAYSLPELDLLSETAAHIRCISQLMAVRGGFASAAEDGFVHLWKLDNGRTECVRYVDSLQLKDCPITGGATLREDGEGATAVLLTVYDRPLLYSVAAYKDNSASKQP